MTQNESDQDQGKTLEDELDELSIKLFRMFARFEYALKATVYHRGDGDAKPNWDCFSTSEPIKINV